MTFRSRATRTWLTTSVVAIALAVAAATAAADATVQSGGFPATPPPPATTPLPTAQIAADGRTAIPPESAPLAVKKAIYAANKIVNKPYRYGGGHARFRDSAYDCSGTVSFALRGGKLITRPLDSRSFKKWGEAGVGAWITVYTNPGHAYVVIAGLRLDTSGKGEKGPRWRPEPRSPNGYVPRHPAGL